jgi:5'-nucleotidase
MPRTSSHLLWAVAALALAACASAPQRTGTVELRVLALNDYHGYLDPPRGGINVVDASGVTGRQPGGGAARLATLVAERRAQSPHSIFVAAGDLIGASPLLSALFHDEPTIEAMTMMGLELSAVGNHEFDEGPAELLRMQNGGCHPDDGCLGPQRFEGAGFQYLAASTIVDSTGLFPASEIRSFDGVRVGFIGLALEGTPDIVSPAGTSGLSFRDEIVTINAETDRLRAQGVEAIIVLIHEGGYRLAGAGECPGLSGAINAIVEGLHPAVDVVVSGHTNGIYICRTADKLLTGAGQYGAYLTDIVLTLDRASGDVVSADAQNIVVAQEIAQDPAQLAHIEAYRPLAAPMANRVVGTVVAPISNVRNDAGESAMGLVIADSMIAAAEATLRERPDIAFMNPGGVRNSFAAAGPVTYEQLFDVQPFGNDIVVLRMTGAQVEAVLNQQFRSNARFILQVSGASFAWRQTPEGGALVPGSVMIGGAPLDRARTYQVATNSFLADGKDDFSAFLAAQSRTTIGPDLDAFEDYVAAQSPLAAPATGRVRLE